MTLNLQWAGDFQDGGLYNGTSVCDHFGCCGNERRKDSGDLTV